MSGETWRYAFVSTLCAVVVLAGCGGDETDEGVAPPSCPAGSHPIDNESCGAELTSWTAGPELSSARDHHVTFIAGAPAGTFLYAIGGASATGFPLSTVERALVAEDGSLAPFESAEKLPSGLIGPGFAQLDRGFVIAGGLKSTGSSTAETWVGSVGEDGALTYSAGPALTASRYHVALVAVKGFVFAMGGLQQIVQNNMVEQSILDVVERASFDGTALSSFEAIGTLPSVLTHHAAIVHEDAIYVIGGGSGVTAKTDILRATVSDAGDLGPWEVVGQLPEGRATSSAAVFLDQLYVIGGMSKLTGDEKATVLRAPLLEGGAVGTFMELPPLPIARAHSHQTPLHEGAFYSVGGSIMHMPQKDVFLGRLE